MYLYVCVCIYIYVYIYVCIYDSFEKFMELDPDSDDDAGMVRSKEEVYI